MDESRHDPARGIVEVYDNPHPSLRFERVLAVKSLAARPWILVPKVGLRDRCEDRLDVV